MGYEGKDSFIGKDNPTDGAPFENKWKILGAESGSYINIFSSTVSSDNNITSTFGGNVNTTLKNASLNGATSLIGVPKVINIDTNKHASGWHESVYATLPFNELHPIEGLRYQDFRNRIPYENILARRFDGASALTRGGWIGGLYAAATSIPGTGGAYSIFNISNDKYFGAGIGDEGNPSAIINDFTMRSHVATAWRDNKWKPTLYPNEIITPFRGDKVSVVDFGQRRMNSEYVWNPTAVAMLDAIGMGDTTMDILGAGVTQDFIKFYFTGPSLHNGRKDKAKDDIMVFRALINNLSDSFNANWTPVALIGRADPNYQYTGFSRNLSLDFTVYATDRDEVKPIWRKLNAMAGYTAPEYDNSSIAMKAPWMRITIGDLFVRQPAILNSISYTLHDADTTWEINIEQDPTMMQVPHKITVNCEFTLITDNLPQKGGKFYTLAKKFDEAGNAQEGNDNWLSEFKENVDREIRPKSLYGKKKENDKSTVSELLADPNSKNLVTGIDTSNSVFNVR